MRRTASASIAVLFALLLGAVLAAPARAKEEPWELAFKQAKLQQDQQERQALKSANKDVQKALANIAQLVERYRQAARTQGSALSHYLYGRILFKQSEYEGHKDARKKAEAIREFDWSRKRGAGWFATYALAYVHFTTEDLERGEAFLSQLLRTHGDRPEVMTLHARVLLARRRWKELKALAEKLLKQNINNPIARELLAMAYMGLKEWKRGQTVLESMIARGDKRLEVRLWLVECLVQQKKFGEAEKEVVALIRKHPKNVGLRIVYVDVLVARKSIGRAIPVMKQVVEAYPKNIGYLGRLSELYLQTKQPAEAEKVLSKALALSRAPTEAAKATLPFVLRNLAFATYEQKRIKDTVGYLEELDRIGKGQLAPHLLDLMQRCYAELGQKDKLIATLKRLLAHMDGRPEARKKLEELIAKLERGETAEPGAELWSRNKLAELVERCSHPDVKIRREGLLEYFRMDLPFVDPVVYQRHDPRIEKDPECRRIVVQILGRFRVKDANAEIVRIASRYVGFALEDPDQSVRTIAAQELGRIGAPAGIIYLMPYLEHMQLDTSKLLASDRDALENEYNAARATLSLLTGRADIEPGAPNWIKIADAPAHRRAWLLWYDGAEGAVVRMRALADLDTVDKVGPRWPLRYVLSDLMKKPRGNGHYDPDETFTDANKNGAYDKGEKFVDKLRTTPDEVWVRTYELMRRHVLRAKERDPAKFAKDKWFPTFPLYADKDLAAADISKRRDELIAWWRGLPK